MQQKAIHGLEKIISELQTQLENERKARASWYNKYTEVMTINKKLEEALTVTKKKCGIYLKAYKASKLCEDTTAKENQVIV
jgi:hypothetical protein